MTASNEMKRVTVKVGGEPVPIWKGGAGDALVLVHGGWGGAASHWSTVWNALAERFLVVAPELPGFGQGVAAGPRSFGEYASWVGRVMDAVGVERAWLVGNSFGAMVSWRLASQAPERCIGLVIVNGGAPPPRVPAIARWLFASTPLGALRRALVRAVLARGGYGPSILARAFADPSRAPEEVRRAILQERPPQLELALAALLADDPPYPTPRAPALLLFGGADRLLGGGVGAARRLQRAVAGAELVVVPDAGHLPQVEKPSEFVTALCAFLARAAPPPAASAARPSREIR